MEQPASSLADRLVLARTEAGLTQDEVAREIGMAQPSYSALERGNSKTTSKIGSLARLFGVDAFWLETGLGAPISMLRDERGSYAAQPAFDRAETPDERVLLRLFRALTEAQRRGLLALLSKGE